MNTLLRELFGARSLPILRADVSMSANGSIISAEQTTRWGKKQWGAGGCGGEARREKERRKVIRGGGGHNKAHAGSVTAERRMETARGEMRRDTRREGEMGGGLGRNGKGKWERGCG